MLFARVSYRIILKGGENHLAPSTYQETVPITKLEYTFGKALGVFEQVAYLLLQQLSLCCCFYALKPPFYNTCADLKGVMNQWMSHWNGMTYDTSKSI